MRKPGRLTPEELESAQVDRATLRRAWGFARVYRRLLLAYLGTIVLAAFAGTLPPLVFKALIDNALPPDNSDPALVNLLFVAAVALAVVITGLNLVNRWLGSRVRGGADLRPPRRAVRPRAAHAHRLLHADPDRVAHVAAVQRRARRPADRRSHGQRGVGPVHAGVHARRHARPVVADHARLAARDSDLRAAGPAPRPSGSPPSPAGAWRSTPT